MDSTSCVWAALSPSRIKPACLQVPCLRSATQECRPRTQPTRRRYGVHTNPRKSQESALAADDCILAMVESVSGATEADVPPPPPDGLTQTRFHERGRRSAQNESARLGMDLARLRHVGVVCGGLSGEGGVSWQLALEIRELGASCRTS